MRLPCSLSHANMFSVRVSTSRLEEVLSNQHALTFLIIHFPYLFAVLYHSSTTKGEPCSENAFKKELACPLCDTVLAKDGIGQIIVRPNNTQIMRMATKLFGLEPDVLCKVMQLGLDFWAKQKRNETVQHVQQVSKLKKELQEAESQINKLSKVQFEHC